jgi:sugar lactone lactonase YvrE
MARAQVSFDGVQQIPVAHGLEYPVAVAVNASGDLFISDAEFDFDKVWEVLAVNGSIPPSPTLNQMGSGFSAPQGIAVDANGDVFVADCTNHAVKEILAVNDSIPSSPTINTLGSGFSCPMDVSLDKNGNIFVADRGFKTIRVILAVGGYSTVKAIGSGFEVPTGVAVDGSGNVFVADAEASTVKEIPASGGYSTTKTLTTALFEPYGIVVDESGNLFVSSDNDKVSEILAAGGYATVNEVVSGLHSPYWMGLDKNEDLFIADALNYRVVEMEFQSVNFGNQAVGLSTTTLTLPFTIASGAATSVGSIAVLTTGVAGLDFGDAGGSTCAATAYAATANCVINVKFTPLAPGTRHGAVVFYDALGNALATVPVYGYGFGPQVTFQPGSQATVGGGFNTPIGVAVDAGGNVFVGDTDNNAVKEMAAAGGYTTVKTLGSGFNSVRGVAIDGGGNVFVADYGNNAVKEILAAGGHQTVVTLGSGFSSPSGVAVDGIGNVFVADTGNNAVKEILAAGGYTNILTLGSGFSAPYGIALDGDSNVFVADFGNNAVKEILRVGSYSTVVTLASIESPAGVAVDVSGNIYVAFQVNLANPSNYPLKEILAAGGYTSVRTLGSGFLVPSGVAVDGNGNVFVADSDNNRIVKMDLADGPSLAFATPTPAGSTDSADGPQTVSLWNSGNVTLNFNPPATGNNPDYPASFPANAGDTNLCAAGTPVDAGTSCDISMIFVPTGEGAIAGSIVLTDNALNQTNAMQSVTLSGTGTTAVPQISWAAPAAIVYGTPLSSVQLDASTPTAGTFTYFPPAGTILSAGTQSLSALFTPTNTAAYTTVTATVELTVNQASQSITFPTIATQTARTDFNLSVTSSSGLPVSLASLTPSVCNVSGLWVSAVSAGSCSIQATQPGNTNYLAAAPVSQTFAVGASTGTTSQTIAFSPIASQLAATTVNLPATATSGLAVSFQSLSPSVCTVVGATASLNASGHCFIQALQGGNSQYFAAAPVTQGFGVGHATQTIAFTPIATQTAATTITLTASASSGFPVSFMSLTPSICTVTGTAATLIASGFCGVQATQAGVNASGNSEYYPASVEQEFGIAHAPQTITFPPIASGQIAGTTVNLVAIASSGLPVSFASTTPAVCTVSGTIASLIAYGFCGIQAMQAGKNAVGNSEYFAAQTVSREFGVAHGTQTIDFVALPAGQVAGSTVTLTAKASSGLPVSFASLTPAVCTVSGSAASLIAYGFCTIQASQDGNNGSGDSEYLPVAVNRQFGVGHSLQVISFTITGDVEAGVSVNVAATVPSGLPVSLTPTTPAVCALSGSTLTLLRYGACDIKATVPGNNAYFAASTTETILVGHSNQTITFPPIPGQVVGGTLNLIATASSGLTVSFASATPGVCSVAGATASFTIAGTCTIQASQAGNDVYFTAQPVSRSFAVTEP